MSEKKFPEWVYENPAVAMFVSDMKADGEISGNDVLDYIIEKKRRLEKERRKMEATRSMVRVTAAIGFIIACIAFFLFLN